MRAVSPLTLIPDLLRWYESVRRPFAWRTESPDPYAVWISEVMSHQSTMATVQPYFQRWIEKFPTLEALAQASEAEVLALWAGLGYYSRARNILKAARSISQFRESHGGAWPRTRDEWLDFSGIGPYSAAAIASICFDDPVLPLDGNVMRVMARLEKIQDPLNQSEDRKRIEARLEELSAALAPGTHGQVGQALMELGSLVCRPGAQARCEICPLKPSCRSYTADEVAQIPKPKRRTKSQRVISLALIYRNSRGALLLRKIPEELRLAGQWEFPVWDLPDEPGLLPALRAKFDLPAKPLRHLITKYVYSVYKLEAGTWTGPLPEDHAFWHPNDPSPGTLTTLTRKILLI